MAISRIYINLPAADLEASKRFYKGIGATVNPDFTDDGSAQLVLGETIFVQLMTHEQFRSFSNAEIPTAGVGFMNALAADDRDEVDRIADGALSNGGDQPRDPMDMGWMYNRAFTDPDGHYWEVICLDEAAMQGISAEQG